MTFRSRKILLTLVALVFGWSSWAEAATKTVAVVFVDPPVTSGVTEVVARLSAELRLAGFQIELIPLSPTRELDVNALLAERPRDGVIVVNHDNALLGATVWVPEHESPLLPPEQDGKGTALSSRTVPFAAEESPSVLAVRAAELLEASLLELPKPVPAPAKPERRAAPPPKRSAPVNATPFHIAALAAGLASSSRVRLSVLPALRVGYDVTSRWTLGAAGAAFGTESRLRSVLGSARLKEAFGVATLGYRPLLNSKSSLTVAFGAGVYRLQYASDATVPYRGRSSAYVAPVLCATFGGKLGLFPHGGLVSDLGALWSLPSPQLDFDGRGTTRLAGPALVFDLGVEAAF